MQVVGLTGGMGVGKSFILRLLEEQGYPVYKADERAKLIMETRLRSAIEALAGPAAFTPEGRLDRKYLGARVFAEPALREALNNLVHPHTYADFVEWVQAQEKKGHKVVFKEAAITLETGMKKGLTALVVVYAPLAVRLQRLKARDNLPESALLARLRSQWPEWKKLAHADFVIVNDGYLPLQPQLQALFQVLHLPSPPYLC